MSIHIAVERERERAMGIQFENSSRNFLYGNCLYLVISMEELEDGIRSGHGNKNQTQQLTK